MRVIIPAAGEGERWAAHGGITKHEALIGRERIIDRLVRQVSGHTDNILVIGSLRVAKASVRKPRLDPAKRDIDKIASSRHLWSTEERTLILFGDVVLTDWAAGRILEDDHEGWRVYGRHGASEETGKRYGELFALSVMPEAHALLDDLIERTAALNGPNRLWHLYRMGVGLNVWADVPPTTNFFHINDYSDDVDTPEEWEVARLLHAPTVAVIMPWREEPTRRPALDFVLDWYEQHHPDLPIILADNFDDAEFSKPAAVNRAAREIEADILVVADADLFVPPANLDKAIALAATKPWVVTQTVVLRLTAQATAEVYGGADPWDGEAERRYAAVPGGGLFVIRRDNFLRIGGFDERFGMWGAEDQALRCAADTLLGRHSQIPGVLVHLWHEPMVRRETPRWQENVRLLKRYREAIMSPAAMAGLIGLDGDWQEGNAMKFQNAKTGAVATVPRGSKAEEHLARRPHWVHVPEVVDVPLVPRPPVAAVRPPRSGPGSSRSVWARYAGTLGLNVDGISREMIIEMCDAHTD